MWGGGHRRRLHSSSTNSSRYPPLEAKKDGLDVSTPSIVVLASSNISGCSGNLLVITSSTIFIIGLSWGGTVYPWSSAHVVATLALGIAGFIVFLVYEAKWAVNPIVSRTTRVLNLPILTAINQVPISILSNRSSLSG